APVDEDFYDDIVVEHARELPPLPAPVEVAPPSAGEDLIELPLTVEPVAAEARASDPDRTPLPVAEGEEYGSAAPARALQAGPPTPVVAARIAAPVVPLPVLSVPDQAPPHALDADYLREQLALYDTERLLSSPDDPARMSMLAFAAGRVAE